MLSSWQKSTFIVVELAKLLAPCFNVPCKCQEFDYTLFKIATLKLNSVVKDLLASARDGLDPWVRMIDPLQ